MLKTENIKQCIECYAQLKENGHAESFNSVEEAQCELNKLMGLAEIGEAIVWNFDYGSSEYGSVSDYEDVELIVEKHKEYLSKQKVDDE